MSEIDIERRAEFHKALSNPVRLKIVESLLSGELCQCEIFPQMGLSQSTISSYLTQLVRAGILSSRRDGHRKMYSIANKAMIKLLKELKRVLAP